MAHPYSRSALSLGTATLRSAGLVSPLSPAAICNTVCRAAGAPRGLANPAARVHFEPCTTTSPTTWPDLPTWRNAETNSLRLWGDNGPCEAEESTSYRDYVDREPGSLAEFGQQVLLTADPVGKAILSHAAWRLWREGSLPLGQAQAPQRPARPPLPKLVPAKQVPKPKDSGLPLNAYMLHNLAHIELNAVDLAWDTVVRFSMQPGLPRGLFDDFAHVADDEGRHLLWCLQRLRELGRAYGDMPAHGLLWQGCELSAGELGCRLAVVPMSQEARGLDAGQRLADKLQGWGDNRSSAVVARIALEERAHVAVGVAWFTWLCERTGRDPGQRFRSLLAEHCPDLLKGPFNHAERTAVGLRREWYDISLWEGDEAGVLAASPRGGRQAPVQELEARLASVIGAEVDRV